MSEAFWVATGRCLADSSEGLYNNGGSITENLGGTHHRPCVVADTDNGIGTQFPRVRNHQLKGFLACGLTKI